MFKTTFVPTEIMPKVDDRGHYKISPVDQLEAQDFMKGENGFRRSDLAAFYAAENAQIAESIGLRLQENMSSFLEEGLTPAEMMERVIPRSCQTPAEVQNWSERFVRDGDMQQFFPKGEPAPSPDVESPKIKFEDELDKV